MRSLKRWVKTPTALLPTQMKLHLLRKLAQLPPSWRTPSLSSYATWLSDQVSDDPLIQSNLGMIDNYCYTLPLHFEPSALFGRPDYYYCEPDTLLLAAALCHYADIFVDIGSFIGYYVFYIKKSFPKMPIHFFEPVPSHFEIISRNVKQNQLTNVIGWLCAVGNYNGTAKFYQDAAHPSCGSLVSPETTEYATSAIEVPIITFSHFAEIHHIQNACVKVDIEGAEEQFIQGAISSLNRINFLIMEVLDSKSSFLTYMAKDLGYKVYHIKNSSLTFCPNGTDDYMPLNWNWLFCHKTPDELRQYLALSKLSVADS